MMTTLEEAFAKTLRMEAENKRKALQAEALKHARKISELDNSITEIARCEHRQLNTYTVQELVDTAENLLDISQDWENDPYTRGQRKRLQNFIKKYKGVK